MSNTAEELSRQKDNTEILDVSGLEKIIEAEGGIISISDEHGADLFRKGIEYSAANDAVYLNGGDLINDYELVSVLQEASKRGYKFKSQLEFEFFENYYKEGKITEHEYQLFAAVKLANYNQVSLEQVLDAFVHQGDFAGTGKFTTEDKTTVLELLESDVTQKKFEKGFMELKQSDNYIGHMKQNLNLYLTFLSEELKPYKEALNDNPNAKFVMLHGNHDPVFLGYLLKQGLDNPDQVTVLNQDAYAVRVQNKKGEGISVIGHTNCLAPMGFYNELFDESLMQAIFAPQFEGLEEENVVYGSLTLDDVKDVTPRTNWHRIVSQLVDGKDYILQVHGPLGKPEALNDYIEVPHLRDVHNMSLEAKLVLNGHIHKTYDNSPNQIGVNSYGVAGSNALVYSLDGKTTRYDLGVNYGSGKDHPLLHSASYYLDKADENYKLGKFNTLLGNDSSEKEYSKAA
jgi:hypothetical protein